MATGSLPLRATTLGSAWMAPAWLSVMPVMAKNSMPISDSAALIQCQLCNCFSQNCAPSGVSPDVPSRQG
jgi:hypothetical protein